jgi:hypothetical protein
MDYCRLLLLPASVTVLTRSDDTCGCVCGGWAEVSAHLWQFRPETDHPRGALAPAQRMDMPVRDITVPKPHVGRGSAPQPQLAAVALPPLERSNGRVQGEDRHRLVGAGTAHRSGAAGGVWAWAETQRRDQHSYDHHRVLCMLVTPGLSNDSSLLCACRTCPSL